MKISGAIKSHKVFAASFIISALEQSPLQHIGVTASDSCSLTFVPPHFFQSLFEFSQMLHRLSSVVPQHVWFRLK